MKSWSYLKEGDTVDILAPGSASTGKNLQAAEIFLKSWGLKTRLLPKPIFSGHPYVANSEGQRVKALKEALLSSESKAIWCLRGGYGALQMVPDLLKLELEKRKKLKAKLLIGYSDISTLHLWLQQKMKWVSCHGPLLDAIANHKHPEKDVREFRNILFGVQNEITFDGLVPMNAAASKRLSLYGKLMAGNLVVLSSSSGTALQMKTAGKIICLEETGERGYRVDRQLQQLEQSGAFKDCLAVIFGSMLGGDEKDGENFVPLALQEFAKRQRVPVLKGLQIGHGDVNRPVFLGALGHLTHDPKSGRCTLLQNCGGQA